MSENKLFEVQLKNKFYGTFTKAFLIMETEKAVMISPVNREDANGWASWLRDRWIPKSAIVFGKELTYETKKEYSKNEWGMDLCQTGTGFVKVKL